MAEDERSRYRELLRNKRLWLSTCFAAALFGFGIIPLLSSLPAWRQVVAIISTELILCCVVIAYFWQGRDKKVGAVDSDESETLQDVRKTTKAVLIFVLFGLLALICFATSVSNPLVSWREFAKIVGAGGLYAGAFFAAGALAGFLFGIPRSVPRRGPPRADNSLNSAARSGSGSTPRGTDVIDPHVSQPTWDARSPDSPYATNTNLEEISDWLTKIIVGLGLINLKAIPERLRALSWYFALVGGTGLSDSIALALMIHFFIAGFFLTYLMTRLYLTGAFTRADQPPTVKGPADLEVKGIPPTDDLLIETKPLNPTN
jgi:hypothetical protein